MLLVGCGDDASVADPGTGSASMTGGPSIAEGSTSLEPSAGTGLDSSSSAGDDSSGEPPAPVREVEQVPCRYPLDLPIAEGTDYACGDLFVPENREDPASPMIKVHFAAFLGPEDTDEALVYLQGGPGSNVAPWVQFFGDGVDSFAANSDVLVVSQRGTFQSEPRMLCSGAFSNEGIEACRDELIAEGVDPSAYTTQANADDVEDLRRALGYQSLVLTGTSYGTALGQEIMRRHPDSVRAAVLDGVLDPATSPNSELYASLWSLMQPLSAACAADAACGGEFGDLREALVDMAQTLDAAPYEHLNGDRVQTIDGWAATRIIFDMLYETGMYPYIPLSIASMRDGDITPVQEVLQPYINSLFSESGGTFAYGVYLSMNCSQYYGDPAVAADIETVIEAAGIPEPLATYAREDDAEGRQDCSIWPQPAFDPERSTPVESAIRTLLVSGQFDPITPPKFGETVAQNLSNSTHVVFANSGHGNIFWSDCGYGIYFGFLDDPQAPIDPACAEQIGIEFVTSPQMLGPSTAQVAPLRSRPRITDPIGARLRRRR